MFDAQIRPYIDPPLNQLGQALASKGITANAVTVFGLGLGLISATLVIFEFYVLALVLMLASRLADGLDGAVARATEKTDFGGYLDIICDFLFYGAIPLAFIVANPQANSAAGSFLLLSFYVNGASFLGYALLAERYGKETAAQGSKSLYYSQGLLEGFETIAFFALIMVLPGSFAPLSFLFAILCFYTALARVLHARQVFTR